MQRKGELHPALAKSPTVRKERIGGKEENHALKKKLINRAQKGRCAKKKRDLAARRSKPLRAKRHGEDEGAKKGKVSGRGDAYPDVKGGEHCFVRGEEWAMRVFAPRGKFTSARRAK